jgi:hypothetical protein
MVGFDCHGATERVKMAACENKNHGQQLFLNNSVTCLGRGERARNIEHGAVVLQQNATNAVLRRVGSYDQWERRVKRSQAWAVQ